MPAMNWTSSFYDTPYTPPPPDPSIFYTVATSVGPAVLPRVTSIISVLDKPGLNQWKVRTERSSLIASAREILTSTEDRHGCLRAINRLERAPFAADTHSREAAASGSGVHAAIEWVLRGELGEPVGPPPTLDPLSAACFARWSEWWGGAGLTPVAVERRVWSHVHKYAGTVDLIAHRGDQLVVVDWKRTKGGTSSLYLEHIMQSVAYQNALREMGTPVDGGLVVKIPRTGVDPVEEHPVPETDFTNFLSLLALWRLTRTHEGKPVGDEGPA